MPQLPSEPEKYSVNEMMERLKNRPSEDPIENGELVTRADGSQAIRVRKRKRRSHQPHKEEQRKTRRARMIQISAAMVLLLLAILGAGVAIAFANSSPFIQDLSRKIALSSGAKVELEQFRMNPATANAARLTLSWPEGNALRELTVRGINAGIAPSSFLGKSMSGDDVTCAEGTLTLRLPKPDQPLRDQPQRDGPLPIRFQRYAIPTLHVVLGEPTAPFIRLRNTEGSFYPAAMNGRAQLLFNRGEIAVPGWPKLRMDRSHIEFRGNETDVVSMRLQHETDNRGIFELAGTIAPYAPDRASTLAVRLESFLISGIAGPDLGRFFSGRIDSRPTADHNHLSFTPSSAPGSVLAVEFRNAPSSTIEVGGFPFLAELARILEDDWFETPEFDDDVTGTIRRSDGKAHIGDLHLETKGRMALRGDVTISENRRLSGSLEVGLADAMVKASVDRRLHAMFSNASDGFRWVTLKIGGSATTPADDFKELYNAASEQKSAADPADEIPSFEELTRPK